jgi:hypothetical protein
MKLVRNCRTAAMSLCHSDCNKVRSTAGTPQELKIPRRFSMYLIITKSIAIFTLQNLSRHYTHNRSTSDADTFHYIDVIWRKESFSQSMADLSQNILYLTATQLFPLHVSLNATFAGAVSDADGHYRLQSVHCWYTVDHNSPSS